jgi:hypothetical protein
MSNQLSGGLVKNGHQVLRAGDTRNWLPNWAHWSVIRKDAHWQRNRQKLVKRFEICCWVEVGTGTASLGGFNSVDPGGPWPSQPQARPPVTGMGTGPYKFLISIFPSN